MTRKQKKTLIRIIVSLIFFVSLFFIKIDLLWLVPYFIIGWDILYSAIRGILSGQLFDECFLMAAATVGAMLLGEYSEGVAVMLFYQVGELFQSVAVSKSRRNIQSLMNIRPDYANLITEDTTLTLSPEEVPVGSRILIKTGERVPLDGVIEKGEASVDTSALTGESVPRRLGVGDELISGTVNLSGVLEVRVTKAFENSTVSRILTLVEQASMKKSRSEKFITRFARIYTPVVCALALLTCLIPSLINPASFSVWIARALNFLVISCPCALVVSVPLSFYSGIGVASREGILVKGAVVLESLSKTCMVAFDKTGTVTHGSFEVTEISPVGVNEKTLLEYAALAEVYSPHPIAEGLKKSWGKELDEGRVTLLEEVSGKGIAALVDKKEVLVGSGLFMQDKNIEFTPAQTDSTVIYCAIDGAWAGHILISDRVKSGVRETLRELKKLGIEKTYMLTGDRYDVAESVGRQIGVDEVMCELLPDGKVECIERIMRENENTLFVGDGINDAPVLMRSTVGVAMGALGSDAAVESADVVLMDDRFEKLERALVISKNTMKTVRQNIVFALLVKLIVLLLVPFGFVNMYMSVFADVGVLVLAVLNSVKFLFKRSKA